MPGSRALFLLGQLAAQSSQSFPAGPACHEDDPTMRVAKELLESSEKKSNMLCLSCCCCVENKLKGVSGSRETWEEPMSVH